MKRIAGLLLVLAGLLSSCAPLSREVMRQVDETLTYRVVQKDPLRYAGKTVLWGGWIVETTNLQEETVLKVRQSDLDLEKRPADPDSSAGRFIVRYAGFLDPVIFREGREITVGGEVAGKESLPLGGIQYTYPVLLAKEIRLWDKREPRRYHPYWDDPFFWGPYWGPYGYPFWRYRPYRRW